MRELTFDEIQQVDGGMRSAGEITADAILTVSGGFLGFCLSGGNPAGMWIGASVGHAFANAIV